MASIRLLAVMLYITWISTSNASTGKQGNYSIDHVDRLDQLVNKATDDNKGPEHFGLPGLVVDHNLNVGGDSADDEVNVLVSVEKATDDNKRQKRFFPGLVVDHNLNVGEDGGDDAVGTVGFRGVVKDNNLNSGDRFYISGFGGDVVLEDPNLNYGVHGGKVNDSESDDSASFLQLPCIFCSYPAVVVEVNGYDDVNNETDHTEELDDSYSVVVDVVDYSLTPNVVNRPQDQVLVRVDNATAETLNSPVTTIFLPILYIIVFVVGLPANTMALWVFMFRTKKKHPSAIYMANLALSDILFVIWIPLKISYHFSGNDWIFGEGLCKVLVGFFYGNMYGSILFIACLNVQRYRVVVDPFSEQNNKMAIGVCVSIWVFIWTTTIPLYQYDYTVRVKDLNITTCHDVTAIWDKNDIFASIKFPYYYFILMATVVFLIPCIVIVVAYVLMLWHLEKKTVCNINSLAVKNRHKALVLIATVLVTFLVCFIPSNIMLVIHYYLLSIGETNTCYSFYIITLCLASLNSCLDPFIYYFVSGDFRKHVKNTLLCRSRRTLERIEYVEKHCRNNKSDGSGNTESSRGGE